MKNLALMTVVTLLSTYSFGQKLQEKDVPVNVKTAFKKNFPNQKVEKWEKEGSNFEASFEVKEQDNSALFDAKGNLLEKEVEIKTSELPKQVKEYVIKNYKGQTIKEAAKITNDKGQVFYEAEIKGIDLLFENNGKFIKEIKE